MKYIPHVEMEFYKQKKNHPTYQDNSLRGAIHFPDKYPLKKESCYAYLEIT